MTAGLLLRAPAAPSWPFRNPGQGQRNDRLPAEVGGLLGQITEIQAPLGRVWRLLLFIYVVRGVSSRAAKG
jgi:hypothetical protein